MTEVVAVALRPAPVLKPKEAAQMAAIGDDQEFGRLLGYGKPTRALLVVLVLVPVIILAIGTVLLLAPRGRPGPPSVPLAWVVATIAVTLAVCGVVVWRVHGRSTALRFYELGVTRWRKKNGDVQRLSYLDVTSMTYTMAPHFFHGMYVGTTGVILLETAGKSGKKGVRHSFQHRQKARGIVNRTFEGTDPMDLVRDAVAEAVSEGLAVRIAETGSAPWTGPATFTKDGLLVKKLLGGVKVLAYEAIDRMEAKGGNVMLFQAGEKSAAASVAVNGKNFWPGFVLLGRLVTPRATDGGAGEDGGEEFGDED